MSVTFQRCDLMFEERLSLGLALGKMRLVPLSLALTELIGLSPKCSVLMELIGPR